MDMPSQLFLVAGSLQPGQIAEQNEMIFSGDTLRILPF